MNFRLRANAHQYFSLKDDHAKYLLLCSKEHSKITIQPKEGMKVLVVGRISLYEAGGSYQIYVEHMEPDGIGALYQNGRTKRKTDEGRPFQGPKNAATFPKTNRGHTSPSGRLSAISSRR